MDSPTPNFSCVRNTNSSFPLFDMRNIAAEASERCSALGLSGSAPRDCYLSSHAPLLWTDWYRKNHPRSRDCPSTIRARCMLTPVEDCSVQFAIVLWCNCKYG
ncbi:unnamed protein product [Citrullus colocynthis]|uniref:Uncharacterized protein n=1 Tax=Citrullus colocynthis TaxID=252529 RepID=A0ABP0Z0I2_9ROSI